MLWLVLARAHASDVDLFDPAATLPAGTGTLQGEAPFVGEPGATAGVLASYAADPVVREFDDGTEEPAVEALVPLVLQGGYAFHERVRIDVALPIYPWVDAPVVDFAGAAAGDLRLQSTVGLWSNGELGVAVVPRLTFPTGTETALVGGGFAGSLLASVGGTGERFGWLANGGIFLTEGSAIETTSAPLGSRVEALAGGWFVPTGTLRIGAEVDFDIGLATGADGANHAGAAHLFGQQILDNGVGFTAGVGTGLVLGVGTPSYRLIAGVSWTAPAKQVLEPVVAAQEEEPAPPQFIPPPAPPRPPIGDRDGDGLTDDVDRCPDEPGPPDEASSDGCPKTVYVTRTEVRIDQRIEFETGKSNLSPNSHGILAEIAQVLLAAPWVEAVEVQGHTDSVGDELLNQRLSQARAESVVTWLVAAGVSREKLLSKGYGESRPMFTNRTPSGRDGNRRVQFVVLATEAPPSPSAPSPSPPSPFEPTPTEGATAPVLVPVDPLNPGQLTVKIRGGEWATVFVDGRRLVKSAPFAGQEIASGSHFLRAENGRLRLVWEQIVTIEPGRELVVVVPLPGEGPLPFP